MARNDVRRMDARFTSKCPDCGRIIKKGEEIVYWPLTRKAQCWKCGEDGYNSAQASYADERMYAGGY